MCEVLMSRIYYLFTWLQTALKKKNQKTTTTTTTTTTTKQYDAYRALPYLVLEDERVWPEN